ncbi:hypothetical protein JY651_19140 [Pyxidicoccus parkwayensis]|uniref:Uncharacterized protein n=1 Tax=Pyxidicoccus parkwayensis TaxID=2813578 RepID=A0ABX7P8W2_9BACT|nr:hypothetical protein [Pyxidicoccus parkwaysis]QSQ26898.1 hypothetical protein JY651_19140 [Pyxidicoccus parkwaysis]
MRPADIGASRPPPRKVEHKKPAPKKATPKPAPKPARSAMAAGLAAKMRAMDAFDRARNPPKVSAKKAEPKAARSAIAAGLASKVRAMNKMDSLRDPPKVTAKKPEPKPARSAMAVGLANKMRAMNKMDSLRDPPKAAAKKSEPKKGLVDRMADVNEAAGRWGNTVKLPADAAMAFNGRDVRGERKVIGNREFGRSGPGVRTVGARNTGFTRGVAGGSAVLGAAQLPFAAASAIKDWRDVARGKGDVASAIGSTTSVASVALNTAKGVSDFRGLRAEAFNVRAGARMAINERAARAGFGPVASRLRANADALSKSMTKQVIAPWNRPSGSTFRAKAKDLASRFTRPQGKTDIRTMERLAERKLGNDPASRKMAKTVARDVQKTTQAVLKGRATAGLALKTGGRFAPGLNGAIAAADVATAAATLKSNASGWKKGTAVVTAAGSVLAATNVPGLSQAGAVVSTLSSLAGSDMGEKAAKKIGSGIKSGAKKVGSGIKSGAKKVGGWLNPFD